MAGEFAGTTVIVDGPFADADEIKFNESMKALKMPLASMLSTLATRNLKARSRSVWMRAMHLILPTSRSRVCWQTLSARARLSTRQLHFRRLAEAAVQPELAGYGR